VDDDTLFGDIEFVPSGKRLVASVDIGNAVAGLVRARFQRHGLVLEACIDGIWRQRIVAFPAHVDGTLGSMIMDPTHSLVLLHVPMTPTLAPVLPAPSAPLLLLPPVVAAPPSAAAAPAPIVMKKQRKMRKPNSKPATKYDGLPHLGDGKTPVAYSDFASRTGVCRIPLLVVLSFCGLIMIYQM
jgi:hypothetical protein